MTLADAGETRPAVQPAEPAAVVEGRGDELTPPRPAETPPAVKTDDAETRRREELFRRAGDVGLTKEEAEKFGDLDKLQIALTAFDRRLAQICASEPEAPPAKPAAAPKSTPRKEEAADQSDIDLDFDAEAVDPKVAKAIKGLHDHTGGYAKRVEQLEQVLAYMIQERTEQNTRQYAERFDGYVAELGDAYADVFGKGELGALRANGQRSAMEKRLEVDRTMAAIAEGCRRVHAKVPPEKELFRRAVAAVLGDRMADMVRGEIREQLKDRAAMALQPSAGSPSPETVSVQEFFRRSLDRHAPRT